MAAHGIDFEDAIRIFEGPVLESPDERHDYGEVRIIAFGVVDARERSCTQRVPDVAALFRQGEHTPVSVKHIVKRTHKNRRDKTDWARVDALSDREIESAVKSDPDAAPILGKEWFRTAKLALPERKVPISLRMDREVVEWFKASGKRYQSRMNAVLKAYVRAQRKAV